MSTETLPQDELKKVLIAQIVVNPYQPRNQFHDTELEELAQSIQSVGLLHPPLVRPLPHSDCYELIAGERRYRACKLANLRSIPVYVRHTPHSISAEAALIENIQRVDLNPLEIAKALQRLMEEFQLSQELLSQRIGKKRSTIANYLRLLSLPHSIQESLRMGFITMGHAKAILALEGQEKQELLLNLILREDMNVREAEMAATRLGEKAKKNQLNYANRDFYLEELERKIQHKLGTKVFIQSKGNTKKGRISIDYYSYDDLDRLLQLLGVGEHD